MPKLRGNAKRLRRFMSPAETLLWRYLKAERLDGFSFRRQVPMGPFIADFVCHTARLVIEIDGESHDFEDQWRRNQQRDRWLRSRGFVILRFSNADVLHGLEAVLTAIREAASARTNTPLPVPPPQGGRERRSRAE